MVEGGCLIQGLPITLIESANYFSFDEHDTYRTAFEADMINLLVGPLAEAKHVALRDNECFSNNLINVNALYNYGGASDLGKVYDYLENFISDTSLHEEKIAELFNQAFQFINSPVHWQAIERLAGYILDNSKNTITCEEAIAVLDKSTGQYFPDVSRLWYVPAYCFGEGDCFGSNDDSL
jgi:3-deoxy-D-arabino-heptulosonate 7-phosphate (DAHP) synthase class II